MAFKITLQPSGRTYDAPPDTTVLNAGLEAGLSLPYSCRAGTCRTCKARIEQGTVDHGGAHPFYLPDDQKAQGYALLCKAKPLSDLVVHVQELSLQSTRPRIVPCRVKRVSRPAPGIAVMELRLPMNENLLFAAGQFVDFLLPDGQTRSYSIATAPRAEGVIDLELHLRHTPGGLFTDRVFGSEMEGSLLKFRGPLGSFYLREDSSRPIVLLASGTGFAPIKAIVDYARSRGIDRPMRLYWGGRRPADLYMDSLARQWASEMPSFDYVPVLSDAAEADRWSGRTGLVHEAVMADHPSLAGHQVYACGSLAMVDAARRDFTSLRGLPESEFLSDAFLTEAERAAADKASEPAI
ncbi:CDP-6-deoxy-delta-3,4-glucoseen reductase [Pigmentiphaga humi]|nr:CDP-6-deoxy-delta-3,4-glucoseen reductase [Pigmentiphaga humi]